VTFGSGFALLSGLARDDHARRYGLSRYAYNVSVEEARARGLDDDYYFRVYDDLQRDHRRKFDTKHTVLSVFNVDGIARDRERTRRALALIADDPAYFATIYVRRVARLYGFTEQLRVVPGSVRPPGRESRTRRFYDGLDAADVWEAQFGASSDHVRALVGMPQRLFRTEFVLAAAALGLALTLATGWRRAAIVLAVAVYYVGLQALLWSEFRHTLPSHLATFLLVGVAVVAAWRAARLAAPRLANLVPRD
jgi:hypothetical protein